MRGEILPAAQLTRATSTNQSSSPKLLRTNLRRYSYNSSVILASRLLAGMLRKHTRSTHTKVVGIASTNTIIRTAMVMDDVGTSSCCSIDPPILTGSHAPKQRWSSGWTEKRMQNRGEPSFLDYLAGVLWTTKECKSMMPIPLTYK